MLIAPCWRAFGSSEQLALPVRTGPLLDQTEDGRNEENSDNARSQHASNDGCTHDLAGHGAGARSRPERDRAQNERKRSHQDWAKPQARSFQCRLTKGLALLVSLFRKLHDQDRV